MTPAQAPAKRWGRAFRRALKAAGMSQAELSRTLGHCPSTINGWRKGLKLPTHPAAVRAADVLSAPRLASLSAELRTKTCPIDDVVFLDATLAHRGIYCSKRCCSTADTRKSRDRWNTKSVAQAALHTKRLNLHMAAVQAMCEACEPDGLCRTSTCELRPVSPLKLAEERLRVA